MVARFTVDDLIALSPPPEGPVDAGSPNQWEDIERELGTVLPADYKLITNVYGTGCFNGLFFLFNAFSGADGTNLFRQAGVPDCLSRDEEFGSVYPIGSSAEQYESIRVIYPDLRLPALYPEPGGLLPLGLTTNGGYAFWLTGGPPEEWPLALYPHGFHPVERHPMPLVDFLVLWLSGKLPDCFNGAGAHFVKRTNPVFCSPHSLR